jgi:fibronectin type 3 domain-containing protein
LSAIYHPKDTTAAVGGFTITLAGKVTTVPFTGTVTVQHGVQLQWNPSAGSVTYAMYRSETAGGPYAPNTSAPLTSTSYFDPSAVSGKTYYYVVRGVNGKGESDNSNEAKVVIP